MSYEFRETHGCYFHDHLADAASIHGDHKISKLLCGVYLALSHIERGCAAFEASDSGPYAPHIALQEHFLSLEAALEPIREIYQSDKELISAFLRHRT